MCMMFILESTSCSTNFNTARERIWCNKYTIGVYYYPWHSNNFHNGEGYLRRNLEPPQLPQLGEYDDTDPATISQHLKSSRYANVNLWVSSWWGAGYQEDNTLKNVILPHADLPGTRIALLYETTSRMKQGIKKNVTDIFYQDVEYIAKTYFDDPNHYRIDNRPVLFVYLTRVLSSEGILETVTTQMRQAAMDNGGHDLYIIGDQVMSNAPDNGKEYEPFILLDGVTNYDVYGNLKRPNNGYAGMNRLNDLVTRNRRWRNEARAGGCAFIPAVAPGYNDRGVRFDAGHTPLSRKLYQGAPEGSLFSTSLEKSLDLTDESTERLLMITSWNEWHEDTQIEPVVSVGQTDQPLNMTCYGDQCNEGLEYKAYGELYLDILRNVTAINNGQAKNLRVRRVAERKTNNINNNHQELR